MTTTSIPAAPGAVRAAVAHEHTADCMSPWAEARRQSMTPQTIEANHRLHMADPDGDPE